MAEFQRPQTKKDLEENFAQLHPTMEASMAHYASARCLYCYDAPCIDACPTRIDIPLFIRQIRTGNLKGAAKTIYDANYFGQVCGKACPTEVLCEGACVYTEDDIEPVEIGALQAFACEHAIAQDARLFDLPEENGRKIAVIGAGPAGISCACELRRLGYAVDVFEAQPMPSGLAVYGTAPYKITNQEVLDEMDYLQKQFGFSLHLNHPIDSKEQLADLEDRYDAIFLGIGLGDSRTLHLPGEELRGCVGATEFIEKVKTEPLSAYPGDRVVVIGGGNTAMDAASESARLGASSVTLAYRRMKDDMSAYDFEYALAKRAGVRGLFNVVPVEITGDEHVKGVRFARTTTENDRLEIVDDSTFELPCDAVIIAAGQNKRTSWLQNIEGIEFDDSGLPRVNAHLQTTNPKYFTGGDCMNGGAEVVNAAAEGKRAARGIGRMLKR